MKIGIAGGIGSGKSYLSRILEQKGYQVYDCDAAAKRLIRTEPEIREKLTELIGPRAYREDGELNKALVSQFLLASARNTRAVNAIVHPFVFRDFEASGLEWMESGIMFESGINTLVDRVVAVIAPKHVRIQRVMERDRITKEKVLEWMDRQMPQRDVIKKADFVVINDGQMDLERQIIKIIDQCNK